MRWAEKGCRYVRWLARDRRWCGRPFCADALLIDNGVFEPSHGDGFTKGGVQFKIIHLNRMVKKRDPFGNAYNQLPTDPFTHPALRAALQPGASQA
jgi:hypothetical protein